MPDDRYRQLASWLECLTVIEPQYPGCFAAGTSLMRLVKAHCQMSQTGPGAIE